MTLRTLVQVIYFQKINILIRNIVRFFSTNYTNKKSVLYLIRRGPLVSSYSKYVCIGNKILPGTTVRYIFFILFEHDDMYSLKLNNLQYSGLAVFPGLKFSRNIKLNIWLKVDKSTADSTMG